MMESIKGMAKRNNMSLIAGYYAPVADHFACRKYDNKHIPLKERVNIINEAIKDTDWMVLPNGLNTKESLKLLELEITEKLGWQVTPAIVCGFDSICEVESRTPNEYYVVCVRRPGFEDKLEDNIKKCKNPSRVLCVPEWEGPDISATLLRKYISNGDVDNAKRLAPASVVEYIINNNIKRFWESENTTTIV
eukprot:TRINITY_DN2058_c0_g1_i3.p1 TRINITY_DN2058_c0_g1~~TRINITY_DN2058_c0_g1_i3.p1  ORF type:complete len:192 (-),score=20.54 TRINITY_DN2058_c0_g1_i3:93-668(-)